MIEQRAGGNDMKLRHLFIKIPQAYDGIRARLNFINKEQGLPWYNIGTFQYRQLLYDAHRIVGFEHTFHFGRFLQVNGNGVGKLLPGKFTDRICFANLAGASHNQRLPVFTTFPFNKQLDNISFHAKIQLC
ncbi:MAG: hypothetical protein WCJ26_04335 [bacterium]